MKQTVTEYMFIDAFDRCGRGGNFSVPARRALFEFYEEMERDTGEETELDPVAVCCEWAEYATAAEAAEAYGWDESGQHDDEDIQPAALEWLRDRTTVLELEDGVVVIQQF